MTSYASGPEGHSWSSVFPWLGFVGAQEVLELQGLGGPREWWNKESISDTRCRREDIDEIIELLAEFLTVEPQIETSLQKLLPALPARWTVSSLEIQESIRAALLGAGINTISDIVQRTPWNVMSDMGLRPRETMTLFGHLILISVIADESNIAIHEDRGQGEVDETKRSDEESDFWSALSQFALYAKEHEVGNLGTLLLKSEYLPQHLQDLAIRVLHSVPSDDGGWQLGRDGQPMKLNLTAEAPISLTRGRRSLKDRAYDVLESVGHPLVTQILADQMDGSVNMRSLKVQLSGDSRFMRSDVDAWALRIWQMRPYTTIKELVAEEVENAGGKIATSDLIHVLTTEFSINESSIRQVASSPPFTARGGIVRRDGRHLVTSSSGGNSTGRSLRNGSNDDGQEPENPGDDPSTDDIIKLMGL